MSTEGTEFHIHKYNPESESRNSKVNIINILIEIKGKYFLNNQKHMQNRLAKNFIIDPKFIENYFMVETIVTHRLCMSDV